MAKPFLSVIIPNYPVTERLPITLIDVDRHLSEQEYSYEIIVVNGGQAEKFGELIKNLKFVESTDESGYGALARQGMFAAKGNWRLLVKPDNIIAVSEFNKILPYFSDDYEVFIAKRGKSFIVFSETAAMQVFPLTKTSRWAFVYEVLKIAKKLKYKIKKVSVISNRRIGAQFNIIHLLRSFWEILKTNWRLRRLSRS